MVQHVIATIACRLAFQLQKDCQLLEELRVMDYSLLLGLHFRNPDYGSTPHATDKVGWTSDHLPFSAAHAVHLYREAVVQDV